MDDFTRTFPGDPYPPARLKIEPRAARPAAPAGEPNKGRGSAPVAEPQEPVAAPQALHFAEERENGEIAVYRETGPYDRVKVGRANIDGAKALLDTAGVYNEMTRSWEIPEEVAKTVTSGEMTWWEGVKAQYEGGEATVARGALGDAAMRGDISLDEARAYADVALLKTKFKGRPWSGWDKTGKFLAEAYRALKPGLNPITGLLGSGESIPEPVSTAANLLPFIEQAMMEGGKDAALVVAGGALAVGAGAATGGAATPAILASIQAGAGAAGAYGVFRLTAKTEGGNLYFDMVDRGFAEGDAKVAAGVAGAAIGALEITGFKYLTAPVKRAVLKHLTTEKVLKSVFSSWLGNYTKELGAEVGVEVAQEAVSQAATNLTALYEGRPELVNDWDATKKAFVDTFVQSLIGMGLIKLPGVALDIAGEKGAKAQAKATAMQAEAGLEAWAKERPVAPVVEAAAPAPSQFTTARTSDEFVAGQRRSGNITRAVLGTGDALTPRSLLSLDRLEDREGEPGVVEEVAVGEGSGHRTFVYNGPDGRPVGALVVLLEDLEGGVANINVAVDPKFQRRGVATRLYDAAEAAGLDMRTGSGKEGYSEAGARFAFARYGVTKAAPPLAETIAAHEAGTVTTEELSQAVSKAQGEATGPISEQTVKANAELRAGEVSARIAHLDTEVSGLDKALESLYGLRKAMVKAGADTTDIDKQALALLKQRTAADQERAAFLTAEEDIQVARGVKLELRPATLEDIVDSGFRAGREEATAEWKSRVGKIRALAKAANLTGAEVRKILRNKNPGLMGKKAFESYLGEFEAQAAAAADRRAAYHELLVTRKEMRLKGERNIRLLHDLPPANKMTAEQLREYIGVLRSYDAGEHALSPRRIQLLKTTKAAGVLTYEGLLKRVAELKRIPVENLKEAVAPGVIDAVRYDTALARQSPLHAIMVMEVRTEKIIADLKYFEARKTLLALGAKALASRSRGIIGHLVPTQTEVIDYLESEPASPRETEAASLLTPDELKFADFVKSWMQYEALVYLEVADSLKTRFEGMYFPHSKKQLSEALKALPTKGVWATLREVVNLDQYATDDELFQITDGAGRRLGLHKMFTHSVFRSGTLDPSQNAIRVVDNYMRMFYHKQAVDAATPLIMTMAEAIGVVSKSEAAKKMKAGDEARLELLGRMHDSMRELVEHYLAAKKGQSVIYNRALLGFLDTMFRILNDMASLSVIALNVGVQLTAPLGEATGQYALLGPGGLLRVAWRRWGTDKGKAILKKYKGVTERGLLEIAFEPGRSIEDNIGLIMYGGFQINRTFMLQNIILGGMTEAEFEAGEISPERLAQLQLDAGRWLDIPGSKSILGSTPAGAAWTKFRGWLIPVSSSILDDIKAIGKVVARIGPEDKRMTPQQAQEIFRLGQLAAMYVAAKLAAGKLPEEDSYLGRLVARALREMTSMFQGARLSGLLGPGFFVAYYDRLWKNIKLIETAETFAEGHEKEGKLKGVEGLKSQLPFASAVTQFKNKEED